MIGHIKTDTLSDAVIGGVAHEGLSVFTRDGRHATLAVIDDNGKIIEAGPTVAQEAWNVAIASYKNFLKGQGHLRVLSKPTEEKHEAA